MNNADCIEINNNGLKEMVYYKGNTALLKKYAVGYSGQRDTSERGLDIVRRMATGAVKRKEVVVSGYARGVDRTAHEAALKAGGETIIVLAEGMERFYIHSSLKDCWDWERVLVLSQFSPKLLWQSWQAMKRNGLILSLVKSLVVVESLKLKSSGGTQAAKQEALKRNMSITHVVEDELGWKFELLTPPIPPLPSATQQMMNKLIPKEFLSNK